MWPRDVSGGPYEVVDGFIVPEEKTVNLSCTTCKFNEPVIGKDEEHIEDVPIIICRRNPPQLVEDGKTYWPVVTESDWCGEWTASK